MTTRPRTKNVYVVVVGDLGRSPRMLNHALSLSRSDNDNSDNDRLVTLLGYSGQSELPSEVTNSKNIRVKHLIETPARPTWMPLILYFLFKTIFQTFALILSLPWFSSTPDAIFLQNTPAVPALMVLVVFCKLRGTRLMLDWHNYGYSILAVTSFKNNFNHPVVKLYRWLEINFAKFADQTLCVSTAMQADLRDRFGLKATVLYDRPPDRFQIIDEQNVPEILGRLEKQYLNDKSPSFNMTEVKEEDKFVLREQRPMLVVSSTSWTEDEDMGLLLEALHLYDAHYEDHLPKVLCVITGKGPTKATLMAAVKLRQWNNVQVLTPWLLADDYPKLLGCADFGVCMHYSSSGVDLPMKVVDMIGAGLPVAAKRFDAIHELVHHDQDGFLFDDASQLADIIAKWAQNNELRDRIKANVIEAQKLRWNQHWSQKVAPTMDEWQC